MVKIEKFHNFQCWQKEIAKEAVEHLNTTIKSSSFQQEVLKSAFTEDNGKTTSQILADILEEIEVNLYAYRSWWRWSKVVAYVNGDGSNTIHYNMRRISTPRQFAGTLLHESLHLKGYSHYGTWATSVPYLVQEIFLKHVR